MVGPDVRRESPGLCREIFTIPCGPDRHIVYAPLQQAAFVANARTVNLLAALRDGSCACDAEGNSSLIECLRRIGVFDSRDEAPPEALVSGSPVPTTVSLFLTTACNLRCTYCYAQAGDKPSRQMSMETAKRGIDFASSNAESTARSSFEVAYHGGGEPTINWHVLVGSWEYGQQRAHELGLEMRAGLATNGVLDEEQVEWIVEHLNGVTVSFDGYPAAHDTHRVTAAGLGSSDRVMETIERFEAAGMDYGIRMTVTHDQIPRLPASVEFICRHFQPDEIQVEPAYRMGRWAASPSAETEGFIAAYRESQRRAAGHGQVLRFSAARLDTLTNHFCNVSQDSFALSPDGNVSACYEAFSEDDQFADVFFYGSPDVRTNGYVFDDSRLTRLRDQVVQRQKFCQGCFAKWHCAGDCYYKSLTVCGRGEFTGTDRCHISRELIKDQILARIAQSGGLFWHNTSEDRHTPRNGMEVVR